MNTTEMPIVYDLLENFCSLDFHIVREAAEC